MKKPNPAIRPLTQLEMGAIMEIFEFAFTIDDLPEEHKQVMLRIQEDWDGKTRPDERLEM